MADEIKYEVDTEAEIPEEADDVVFRVSGVIERTTIRSMKDTYVRLRQRRDAIVVQMAELKAKYEAIQAAAEARIK